MSTIPDRPICCLCGKFMEKLQQRLYHCSSCQIKIQITDDPEAARA